MMTLRGQILVRRTDDDTALPSVCPFKTSPCMPAPRAHVEKACVRVAGIHGDVLNVHKEVFSVPHHTAHTQHNTESHKTSHGERGKKRERQKKKKEKTEKEREEKTEEERHDKRRDQESRQEPR